MGEFALSLPRSGCDRAVITWEKESFSRNIRTVRYPTLRTEVELDVVLSEMTELICGAECSPEDPTEVGAAAPAGEIARGWVGGVAGQDAVAAMPGEFFDLEGRPLLIPVVTEADYRDIDGNPLATLTRQPFVLCTQLPESSFDELQDATPGTDAIEFVTYTIDGVVGRWKPIGTGLVSAGGLDENGRFVAAAYPEDALADLRRGVPPAIAPPSAPGPAPEPPPDGLETPTSTFGGIWMCAQQTGSSITGMGYAQAAKGCVVVQVLDACGRPDEAATVEGFGRDRSFYTWSPTDAQGTACLEAQRSEAVGEAQSLNGPKGETFWLDVNVLANATTYTFEAVAMPTQTGQCGDPGTCTTVTLVRPLDTDETCQTDADAGAAPPSAAPTDAPAEDGPANGDGPIVIGGK
jgi:hypothetical protein